ncbi:hypothetical protein [Desulfosporosinus lacus]|uniref:Lipoprotein n=1 Tax=Desulfosporosinus lacus DSM 15449 TaxID=1121420 RepID=A0A1M5XAE1_9FIRM|nr:hypothetical protein [Desulfosporosinus lacus]SHH96612.1 hypothetical protein SAMN02746098_01888 [Desulfosporosinus lacus DSM 15449]
MRKGLATIAILLISITMLIGCGKTDPVQEDLINYINNQMPTLLELQDKVSKEYEVSVEKNVDDAAGAVKLKDVIIPASNELLTKAKAIIPATEEVRKVHSEYIEVITQQDESFKLLLQVFEAGKNNDLTLMDTLNEKLKNISEKPNNYSTDLEALKKEHKVEDAK